jgi:vancomycin resistance protein YoaR
LELKVFETAPKTSLSESNNLGINELIGEGISSFKGSPNNRRHNIAVGLEKFKGIIIPPGQEFSFNQNLGPVTAEAGFLPELVIKGSEGTIPELGGGLCQVSTTVFRAAMAAGLPITDRRNHAYAVQYYSPQGTDATIYPGSADLKFVNNTPASVLIWTYEKDANTLIFDFYGTKDGRKVTLEKPVVYDKQADGSMKATWTRIITKDGQTSTSTFKSVYQSPALFHKTEGFVSSTGTIVSGLKIPAVKTQ